jgi:hypothetical protein
LSFVLDGILQDVADFLLHAATVALCALAQSCFHFIV